VAVKSECAQKRRALLKAREHLVGQLRSRGNVIRGLLGTFGIRLAKGTGKFERRVRAALVERPDLAAIFEPLLGERAALHGAIEQLDRAVDAVAKSDPACRLLMTAPAVGPVTALAYVATIDEAARFAKSRAVGAYVGLTSPAQPIGRDGLQRPHLQTGRPDVARPALRCRQQFADPGAPCPSVEDLDAAIEEEGRPQEGLRRLGPQAGGDPAPHADHRRSLRLTRGGRYGKPVTHSYTTPGDTSHYHEASPGQSGEEGGDIAEKC
jgi:hypothetical protein